MLLRAVAAASALVALAAVFANAGGATVDPIGRRVTLLGRSADGRPITAIETGDLDAPRRTLVVGCIHGNEAAGVVVAERLAHDPPPHELDLWIIPDLNPDGVAASSRGNGRGVDLNRNFPYHWHRLYGIYDSGPHALSEPESRIAERLVIRLNPQISIWFHQHLDLVDQSGGNPAVERRFATLTGMRVARLLHEPGSAVGWENERDPAATAFVVELPAGTLPPAAVTRYAHAITALAEPSRRMGAHRP